MFGADTADITDGTDGTDGSTAPKEVNLEKSESSESSSESNEDSGSSSTFRPEVIERVCHLERDIVKYYDCGSKRFNPEESPNWFAFDEETQSWVELFPTHQYVGPAYQCEDCYSWGCKECLVDDHWEERLKDGVFLCWRCYLRNQSICDVG